MMGYFHEIDQPPCIELHIEISHEKIGNLKTPERVKAGRIRNRGNIFAIDIRD